MQVSDQKMLKVAALLLLTSTCSVLSAQADAKSANVPSGAGFYDPARTLDADFGMFGKGIELDGTAFSHCGTHALGSLNPSISSANVDIDKACEPVPTRVWIVKDHAQVKFGDLARDVQKECEVMTCSATDVEPKDTVLGQTLVAAAQVDVKAGEPEMADRMVCKGKKTTYSAADTEGAVLLANEEQCYATYPSLKALATDAANPNIYQVPRWLENGKDTFHIRPFYYPAQRVLDLNEQQLGFDVPTDIGSLGYKPCLSACDKGQVVKLTMNEGAYRLLVSLKHDCDSFKMCFHDTDDDPQTGDGFKDDTRIPRCVPQRAVEVLVGVGAVVWPNKGRASLLEMRPAAKPASRPVVVEIGFGIEGKGVATGATATADTEFYVANMHQEVVTSDSAGFNPAEAAQITFFFPQADCLLENAGIFSKNIQNAKALTDKTVHPGKVYGDKGQDLSARVGEEVVTTTEPPIIHFDPTTTPASAVVVPQAVSAFASAETNLVSAALYVAGKWWTWGLYVGFVIGTLLSVGLGGGLFYVLRRTVFGVWYRGMYKRYGCDVSGTTGGITGVGFGNTVTGDVTVQTGATGASTMGTTGGGTTGTSGGQSTMGGNTNTSSSVAM